MSKNPIFRTTAEENGSFVIEGTPNYRMQTSQWVQQGVQINYYDSAEEGRAIWTGDFPPYDGVEKAFFPFGKEVEVTDPLILNRTFESTKFQPENSLHAIDVDVETQLELRKLVCSKRARDAVERVFLPEGDQAGYNWELRKTDTAATTVNYDVVALALDPGGVGEYRVDVPICKFGRTLFGYYNEYGFTHAPQVRNLSMRQIRFAFDWNDGKFKYPGGPLTIDTRDLRPLVGGAVVSDRPLTLFIPPLETSVVGPDGFAKCV